MNQAEMTAFLDNEVYPNLQRRAVEAFPELGFVEARDVSGKKNGYKATQGDHAEHLYYYDNRPHAFVIQGGKPINLWNYIKEKESADNRGTLEALCKLAGVPVPESDPAAVEAYQKAERKRGLLEEAQALFIDLLMKPEGKPAADYMKARGWGNLETGKAGFGFCPGLEVTAKHLVSKGFTREEVAEAFPKSLPDYKIIFPWRDSQGRIKSFWTRITRPLKEGEKIPKYLPFSTGATKETPFLFDKIGGTKRVILVEGFFDALSITYRGNIPGAVALGGTALTDLHLGALTSRKGETFILALDNDEPGQAGTEAAVVMLAKKGLPSFVLQLPEGIKDPDELLNQGEEAFKKALQAVIPGAVWLARRIAGKAADPVHLEEITRKALKLEAGLPLESSRFGEVFLKEVARLTGFELQALLAEASTLKEKEARKRLEEETRNLLKNTEAAINAGQTEEAIKALEERAKDLHLEALKRKAPEEVSLSDFLREKRAKDETREGLLGYRLPDFPKIEAHTEGIQPGLYIIGAVSNVGKTSLLTGLVLSILHGNPETRAIYFSLDDNKEVIINRLLARLSVRQDSEGNPDGLRINQARKKPENAWQKERLDAAYEGLHELVDSGRLNIRDISDVGDFSHLEILIRENPGNLVVAIDGLYNIPMEEAGGGIRETNVERANRLKALVDTYRIPLIGTAEIRKKPTNTKAEDKVPTLDDLMESGKYGYNANLVWLLHETGRCTKEANDGKPIVDALEVDLIFAKNKVSDFKGIVPMLLHPALATYRERPPDPKPSNDWMNKAGPITHEIKPRKTAKHHEKHHEMKPRADID